MENDEILKSAATMSMKGSKGVHSSFAANGKARGGSADATIIGGKGAKNNDWIPSEAVRAILKIKERYKGEMTETAISQILYELNSIWRKLMRNENEAIK